MVDEGMTPWRQLALGMAMSEAGSSKRFNTGDWRGKRYPVIDREKCIKCGLCWIVCPDMAYLPDEQAESFYKWDSYYCKGCGICIAECPKQAISWQEEKDEDKYGPACGY